MEQTIKEAKSQDPKNWKLKLKPQAPFEIAYEICINAEHICTKTWTINQKYIQQRWLELINYILEIQATTLRLNRTTHMNILKDIQDINFPHLQILSLVNNQIQSIQCLCRISLPFLRQLDLSDNKITNLSGFNRSNLKNLKIIILNGNLLSEMRRISQTNLPQLVTIRLQWKQNDLVQDQSISWIFAIESFNFEFFRIHSRNRRKQQLLDRKIVHRWVKAYVGRK